MLKKKLQGHLTKCCSYVLILDAVSISGMVLEMTSVLRHC